MNSTTTRQCRGYKNGNIAPHLANDDNGPDGFKPGSTQCRKCYAVYYEDWKAGRTPGAGKRTRKTPSFSGMAMAPAGDEFASDAEAANSHEYRPDADLVRLWHAVVSTAAAGAHPQNLMFLGPSGSGKTDGARYLAALVGLPFTKIDAASMIDAADWFGTREVVEENGTSVTRYSPSDFVNAIQHPGVVLIDEANRVRDDVRNVLLPIMDGTHRVTNPLTGETLEKDPRCFIILSGNRGLAFTGTYAIDPALMTRCLVVDFDYIDIENEVKIAIESTGCDEETARLFVRFANETRERAKADPDITPMSTREVIEATRLVARGLSADLAVRFATLNAASAEGGAASARNVLEVIWAGLRKSAAQDGGQA